MLNGSKVLDLGWPCMYEYEFCRLVGHVTCQFEKERKRGRGKASVPSRLQVHHN